MSFATEIAKTDSERFFLVQITARKEGGTATSTGVNTWTCAVSSFYKVTSVYVNGSSVGSFTQSSTTVAFTSAVDLTNPTNYVHLDVDMYLTGGTSKESIGISGLPNASWDPRVQSYPSFSQSMRDIADGVFSLSSSEIRIISTDGYHQKYLSSDVSMSKAIVRVWMCINELTNNRLVFQGEVSSNSFSKYIWSIGLIDTFNRLQNSALFGSEAQSYYRSGPGVFLTAEDEGAASPVTFGYSSPMTFRQGFKHLDPWSTGVLGSQHNVQIGGIKAVRFSPQFPDQTSTCSFFAGRVYGNIKKINLGTIVSAYRQWTYRTIFAQGDVSPGSTLKAFNMYAEMFYLQCTQLDVCVGDYIPELNGNVTHIGNLGFGPYNVYVMVQRYGSNIPFNYIGNPPPVSSGAVAPPSIANNTHPSMSVWMENGDTFENEYAYIPAAFNPEYVTSFCSTRYVPFTTSTSTYTFNGETFTSISFSVNPATAQMLGGTNNPENPLITSNLKYSYRTDTQVSHARAIKTFVTSSGLTPNNSSFSQAELDLPDSLVSITTPPELQKGRLETYLQLCQKIMASTIGVLGLNPAQEVLYKILKSSIIPDKLRDSSDILYSSSSLKVEYQDITTDVEFSHPQLTIPVGYGGSNLVTRLTDDKKSFLHRSKVTKTVSHYLFKITECAQRISNYLKQPTIEYNIATSSKDLAASIGETVEITNQIAANSSGTVQGLIVGLDFSSSKTSIKINEIRGL